MSVFLEILTLFGTFFKIGLFTFGGGYAMLPLIQQEVLKNGWMELAELMNFVAVSESTPGPFAINMATFVGSERLGAVADGNILYSILGSAGATLGVVLPSFIVILIVARIYEQFKTNKYVAGVMTGLKPAAIGLIGGAVITMAKSVFFPEAFTFSVLKTPEFYISALLFAVMSFFIIKKKVHPVIIISISAVVGIASGYMLGL